MTQDEANTTARGVLKSNRDVARLSDDELRSTQIELLEHAVQEQVLSLTFAASAIPEANLLLRVTREVDRRQRRACSPLNRLLNSRVCREWRRHDRVIDDLEVRLQAAATRHLI